MPPETSTIDPMRMSLSIHNTDAKLWLALCEAYEVQGEGHTKWIVIKNGDIELVFFKPHN